MTNIKLEDGMEIDLLRMFLTIAKENSMTLAAQRLNTVQSNVSARLKSLEDEVGQSLFLRTKKGMYLTETGEKLKPLAAELVQRAEDIKLEIRKEVGTPGHVKLGVPETFLRTYLRRPLEKWVIDHPGAKVRLKTGYSHQISADLENKEIDFGVIIARERPKQFFVVKEFKSKLCIVAPKTVTQVNKAQLESYQPMLLGDSCFFGQAVMQLSASLGINSRGFEYLHSIETILQCVSIGLGYSVMPACLLQNHPLSEEVSIYDFVGKKHFSFYKVCLPSRKNSKLVREISAYLK